MVQNSDRQKNWNIKNEPKLGFKTSKIVVRITSVELILKIVEWLTFDKYIYW